MATQDVTDRMPGERRGSVGLVLLVAIVLIGAAVGLMFVGRTQAEPYVLALLAILGMIGVFSLFATAAGILQVAGKDNGSPILRAVTDGATDGDRNETAFQGLQHAIDYLDHAPAGFFSVDASGHIGYLNATLAGWLDHDLAQIGSAGLKLADIVPGDSVALLTTLTA